MQPSVTHASFFLSLHKTYHAEITATSGPVVVVSLRRIGARGALYVECRIGAQGVRYVTGYSIVKINYKTNTTLSTLNKVASQKKKQFVLPTEQELIPEY
jgi:hypothetical protein